VVNRDWRLSTVTLADGRVLSGVVVERNDRVLTLQGVPERVAIPADEIDEIIATDRSPMPDGLLDQLSEAQVRDLVAYLRHPTQGPLPE
jgi:putative heme-binding domain-containing protein